MDRLEQLVASQRHGVTTTRPCHSAITSPRALRLTEIGSRVMNVQEEIIAVKAEDLALTPCSSPSLKWLWQTVLTESQEWLLQCTPRSRRTPWAVLDLNLNAKSSSVEKDLKVPTSMARIKSYLLLSHRPKKTWNWEVKSHHTICTKVVTALPSPTRNRAPPSPSLWTKRKTRRVGRWAPRTRFTTCPRIFSKLCIPQMARAQESQSAPKALRVTSQAQMAMVTTVSPRAPILYWIWSINLTQPRWPSRTLPSRLRRKGTARSSPAPREAEMPK